MIFLDESGDLGWSFDKPSGKGGSSRHITIAGIAIEQNQLKYLARYIDQQCEKLGFMFGVERKGSLFSDVEATALVTGLKEMCTTASSFKMISITSNKQNVIQSLRRDKHVFYNYMLNNLLVDIVKEQSVVDIVLDNRTIRLGSRNSFEDCLRAKCWGELGLDVNISCRFEESERSRGIWVADWLANFIWRHYEKNIHDAYLECCAHEGRYHEKTLFM